MAFPTMAFNICWCENEHEKLDDPSRVHLPGCRHRKVTYKPEEATVHVRRISPGNWYGFVEANVPIGEGRWHVIRVAETPPVRSAKAAKSRAEKIRSWAMVTMTQDVLGYLVGHESVWGGGGR